MRQLSDKELKRVKKHPTYDGICPTCRGEGDYEYKDKVLNCDCKTQLKLQRLYLSANIGPLYHTLSFDDFFQNDPELETLKEFICQYIKNFESNFFYGRGVTFDGPLGTGKSFAATLILKELLKQGWLGYFITFDDLLNIQSQGWKDKEYNEEFYLIRDSQVLILDELYASKVNSSKGELLADTLERIVRFRVANTLPTIITTNLTPEQEKNAYSRVSSLLATAQVRYSVHGEDRRKAKVRSETNELIKNNWRKPIV